MTEPSSLKVVARHKDWLACNDCGALQKDVSLHGHTEACCAKCGASLRIHREKWVEPAAALAVTSLILFVACNAFTFLSVEIAGQAHSATLFSGVMALLERNQWLLASLVFATVFLYPMLELFALLYVLIPFTLRRRLPGQVLVFRYLVRAQPWNMMDVFLLGALVTAIKMRDIADVYVEPGGYLFFALVVCLQSAYWLMNKKNLWNWLKANNYFTYGRPTDLCDCTVCGAMVDEQIVKDSGVCPRCESPIYKRKPKSLEKTTALLFAAMVLYIPANLLPIMDYEELNEDYSNTIITGVLELIGNDLWGIAAIIFIASVVVPIAKLVLLSYLVWSVKCKHQLKTKTRAFLYRLTEVIGRWSMVDVYVVTLLTAIVQFGFIGVVEPGAALLPFAAVVVLTMLAADAFDPRLIWDCLNEPIPENQTLNASGRIR